MAVFADRERINCQSCPTSLKAVRHCVKESPKPYYLTGIGIDGAALTWCPRKYVGGRSLVMIAAYREYKAGFLPNPGGWLDQCAKFTSAMAIIDGAIARMEEKEHGK